MILTIFLVLLGLALVLTTLGYVFPEHLEMAFIGIIFLFLLSLVVQNGSLEYRSGHTEVFAGNSSSSTSVTTYDYTEWEDTSPYGFWLMMLSITMFSLTAFYMGGDKRYDE